jgi:hypothetical protein
MAKKKIILFTGVLLLFALIALFLIKGDFTLPISEKSYLTSNTYSVPLYDENLKEIISLPRGVEVVKKEKELSKNNEVYSEIEYDKKIYYVKRNNIVTRKEDIIKEKEIFVRTPTVLYVDAKTNKIGDIVKKGERLEAISFNKINEDGTIDIYKVKKGDKEFYIYGKYTVLTEEAALAHYKPDEIYKIHGAKKDTLGGGSPANLDYYPRRKPVFKDNKMPDPVYAWYLNSSSGVINNVDAYIAAAKDTKINAFVVDIKDNGMPGYKSEVMKNYSPTNYAKANNSLEDYKKAIGKLKDAGYYVIGRITVFKDEYFVEDHPEYAILRTGTNEPYRHQDAFWPSAFQRDVWEFNVNLAKEAVKEMGFNEIQFDYVRFPDLTRVPESQGLMDFRNTYGEEKAQAIQGFLMYATDQLHKLETYVSADVFGESANGYVTAYGQYWPAISNVVDVISGMPYTDHFSRNEYGFTVPVWTVPYQILTKWASYVVERQKEIPTPAIPRTWIQAYDVQKSREPAGLEVNADYVFQEIKALFDAGLTGGYMTWKSDSDLSKYQSQLPAYKKDYKEE